MSQVSNSPSWNVDQRTLTRYDWEALFQNAEFYFEIGYNRENYCFSLCFACASPWKFLYDAVTLINKVSIQTEVRGSKLWYRLVKVGYLGSYVIQPECDKPNVVVLRCNYSTVSVNKNWWGPMFSAHLIYFNRQVEVRTPPVGKTNHLIFSIRVSPELTSSITVMSIRWIASLYC